MPRISVIVPVFNASRWIESCIQSLLHQDYDPARFEIIMVDNNSTDDSAARIRRCGRIRLLHEPVQSSYAARNRGVRQSRGEVLVFTDSDCAPAPNWLSVVDVAMRNPEIQVVLGARAFASDSRALGLLAAYEDARVEYILTNHRKDSYFAFTNNMAIRRVAFERCGPFPEVARGGDTLFLRKLAEAEGAEAAAWNRDMRISHLELRNIWAYLKKSFVYARARRQTRHLGQCAVLAPQECLQIMRSVVGGRPVWDKIVLASLLSTGRLTWTAGSLL